MSNSTQKYQNVKLSENSSGTGFLYNNEKQDTENAPTMSGTITMDGQVLPVSGFLQNMQNKTGQFLSLSIGAEGNTHYRGALFVNSYKKTENPTLPDYQGQIYLLEVIKGQKYDDEDWVNAATLKLTGWKDAGLNKARIKLVISSRIVKDGELAF